MPELKPISQEAIPQALEKATRYRLLNQPWQAESICRDILRTDPDNQQATHTLILAITDQFEGENKRSLQQAREVVSKLTDNYETEYCLGLIYERQARAALKRSTPRASYMAYEYLNQALQHYKNAEEIRQETNEESILRWNACIRFIKQHNLKPAPDDVREPPFLDV
ncbi:tetratricopeptide repeat protein [Fodinibius salsisoli]|uniref:Tetratricopeptide repeat-containing protein n=1 Tax=Fodinibius salsisoli TaxID=2820877 RepID=A0ABT3PSP8_9BACT|nr:hypothetical protein [Fodinibius salsisoli]MCW9708878.1 hypothetical protein [Fodinibius salsisoli]